MNMLDNLRFQLRQERVNSSVQLPTLVLHWLSREAKLVKI